MTPIDTSLTGDDSGGQLHNGAMSNIRGAAPQEVARRLGISPKSLYVWVRRSRSGQSTSELDAVQRENAKLKGELKRVEEERDILKKAAAYFARASE